MIRKIKFDNFYSFNKPVQIDLCTNKKKTYSYARSLVGDDVTKVAAFVGSNASGKTNVMRALTFLSYFICSSGRLTAGSGNEIAFKTHFNNLRQSTFRIEFEHVGNIFSYELVTQENTVLLEFLKMKSKTRYSKSSVVFKRSKSKLVQLNKTHFKGFPKEFLEKNIRQDMSVIAFIRAHYDIKIITIVYNYFYNFRSNINERGETNNPSTEFRILELYAKDSELKKDMESFVANFDTGLSGFEILKKETSNAGVEISVTGVHNTAEKKNKLAFVYESSGTRSLFFLYSNIVAAIKNDSVLIIDELECGLHPEALNKLITYIIDENQGHRAQIFFTSHSLGFMRKLDMHQLFLVEKNKKGESDLFRLNDVEGIRSDENFFTRYMTGAYGAFPKVRV